MGGERRKRDVLDARRGGTRDRADEPKSAKLALSYGVL